MKERRGINGAIDAFNGWFDVFVIAVAKPLAMLGFAMGTVDIFTRGGLATQYWFALAWSVVQAVTIDGLFFAVWYRVFDLRWERGNWRQISALLFIGGVLSVVAFTTNAILGYQQLWGLSDSQQAMLRLGIDPQQFTLLRAVLVVAVAVMIAYVYRSASNQQGETVQNGDVLITRASKPTVGVSEQPNERGLLAVSTNEAEREHGESGVSTNEHNEQYSNEQDERSESGVSLGERRVSTSEHNEQAQQYSVSAGGPENEHVSIAEVAHETEMSTAENRVSTDELPQASASDWTIVPPSREVVMNTLWEQPGIDLKTFARETGIPYSTLTRWKREAFTTKSTD